jgi:hypothetical protein
MKIDGAFADTDRVSEVVDGHFPVAELCKQFVRRVEDRIADRTCLY